VPIYCQVRSAVVLPKTLIIIIIIIIIYYLKNIKIKPKKPTLSDSTTLTTHSQRTKTENYENGRRRHSQTN
jgi:hypothetical protein